MQQIIDVLKQSLLDQHVPSEQVQDIMNSVDVSQINLQDLPATQEYLGQFLSSFNLQETVISNINAGLFENLGISNIPGLDPDNDILGSVGNIISGFFGGN